MTTRTQTTSINASSLAQPQPIVRYADKQHHAEKLNDADLCAYIEKAFEESKSAASYNLPYLAVARKRFAKPGRRVPVPGQPTWTEWISQHVGITDRHVRRLLAEYREKQLEESDPAKAEQHRLEAELKKAENEKKRAEATQKREAAKVLQSLLAFSAVEISVLLMAGEIEHAKRLASSVLKKDTSLLSATAVTPCSGCEQLHSGIAAVLALDINKPIDVVARECGVSTTVVRQAAIRFNHLSVLAPEALEVANVA